MSLLCARYCPVRCRSGPAASGPVTQPQHRLPAVRRSLAGLPVHRAEGGLLVVPVLTPSTDNIPFGLALSWQRLSSAAGAPSRHYAEQEDLYELQYVLDGEGELCARSGVLQSIAAGDSILAPVGRAWCQIGSGTTSDLAVLKLLVPGSLPSESVYQQQGLTGDGASNIMHDWQEAPVMGKLAAQTVSRLLMGARKQAALASDTWHGQGAVGSITSSVPVDEHTAQPVSTAQAADSGEASMLRGGVQRLLPARLPKQAHLLFQGFAASSHKMLSSIGRSRLADVLWPDQCVVRKALADLSAFQLPNQTNRLALMFDPMDNEVPFTFGLEIFEPGHKTKPHTHAVSHELFFILAGDGVGFCDGDTFPVTAGDVVVFPPTSLHGIDNGPDSKMYCLELMLPNDMFAEFVRQGQPTGKLRDDDMCIMIAQGCASG